MRALSLWQPWANFVADGTKRYETRSWRTSYTGLVAIHASKNKSETRWSMLETDGPFGAVVAAGRLVACHRTEDIRVSESEWEVGDFTPGRYAWELTDVVKLAQPVPLRGYQGLWNLSVDLALELEMEWARAR